MSKILITGATGTVGGGVLRMLKTQVDEGNIVVGVRNPAKFAELMPRVPNVRLDFDNPATLAKAVEGVETVFLVTGYSVSMLIQSKLFIDAAKAAGVRHIVHLGASGSSTSLFQHMVWHDYVERYIQTSGLDWTHLQPKTFMQNILTAIRPGSTTIRQFYGDTVMGWIDPSDIAEVAAVCLTSPQKHNKQIYELSEEALSVHDIAKVLSEETGITFVYEPQNPQDMPEILAKTGMEPTYGLSLAGNIAAIAAGQVKGIDAVYGTVQKVTGHQGTSWRNFARKNAELITKKSMAVKGASPSAN